MIKNFCFLAFWVLFDGIAISQTFPTENLVAYYPFDGNARDYSGNGNNASPFNVIPASDRYGNENGAYFFNGDNAYIDLNNLFDYQSRTISFWFKPDSTGNKEPWTHMVSSASKELRFGFFEVGLWNVSFSSEICGQNIHIGNRNAGWSGGIINNKWCNYTIAIDDSLVQIYRNGTFDTGWKINYRQTKYYDGNFKIGVESGYPYSYDNFYKGYIDDFFIYDKALNACEIFDLYRSNKETLYLANYSFNSHIKDSSSKSLAVNNGATFTSDRNGNLKSALEFNGISDHVAFNTDFESSVTYGYGASMWFKVDPTFDSIAPIFTIDHAELEYRSYYIHVIRSNGKYHLQVGSGKRSASGEPIVKSAEILPEQWYMVSFNIDRGLKVYLNSEYLGSRELYNSDIFHSNDGAKNALLGTSRLKDHFFKGKIDEFKFFERNLTDCDIIHFYNEEATKRIDSVIELCPNGSLKLESDLDSIQWYNNNNQLLSSDSNFYIENANSSLYKAVGRNACGCLDEDVYRMNYRNRFSTFYNYRKCPDIDLSIENQTDFQPLQWLHDNEVFEINKNKLLVDDTVNSVYLLDLKTEYGCLLTDTFRVMVDSIIEPVFNENLLCPSFIQIRKLEIPNIVTANGDGYNDKFVIKNLEIYPNYTLRIYDRIGSLVLNSNFYQNDWPPENLLSGVYFYDLIIKGQKNKQFKGYIHLEK